MNVMWLTLLAGDPGELCEAIATADVVIEVRLTIRDGWPPKYREKQWEPPASAIQHTIDTARMVATWKGQAPGWTPDFSSLGLGNQSIPWWDRFFSAKGVSVVSLLKKGESGWQSVGWLEDSGLCHMDHCWEPLRKQIGACVGRSAPISLIGPSSPPSP